MRFTLQRSGGWMRSTSPLDHDLECGAINQINVATFGKLLGIGSKNAGRHHKPSRCTLCGHHAEQFPRLSE